MPADTTAVVHNDPPRPEPDNKVRLNIHVGEKTEEVSYQQAFVLGHKQLKRRQFALAVAIFEELARIPDRGPRAHIMLAIGKSGLSQYAAAQAVLNRAPALHPSLAAAIYDVIVQSRMGFKEDAVHDLVEIVNEHKDLPTLCLWLGDMLEANQQTKNAVKCWQLAQKRDRVGGAVAVAANQQLRLLKKGSDHPGSPGPEIT